MKRYVLSRGADRDLDDLWDYVAADNVDAADRLIQKLMDVFEALAQHSGMGHKREDLTDYLVLFWPVGNYLVIYQAEQRPIRIVAIVHGNRDIPTFLHGRNAE